MTTNKKILGKIKKHFYIARTELQKKDTRTLAVFADNLYRLGSKGSDQDKEEFMKFVRQNT